MSVLEDFLNQNVKPLFNAFFDAHAHEYDLTHNDGCGKYTEAAVAHVQISFPKVGHLKKNPVQTQYNGHANDAFLYREGDPTLYRAVDIIGAAESTDPSNPPRKNFGIDIPRYEDKDWLAKPGTSQPPVQQFPGYEELGGDQLCRVMVGMPLQADYLQAGKPLDDGSVVWTNRTVYDALHFIFVEKQKPEEAYRNSAFKHRPEWRKELGLPPIEIR